jgi:hypothetical protein
VTHFGLILLLAAFYILLIAGAIVFLSWMEIQRRINMERMRKNVSEKLAANVILSVKDIACIGRGFDLSAQSSRDVVYKLYVEANAPASFEALKTLIAAIENDEPFDELPDEVKPSLSRIGKLIESSSAVSDKNILLPISTTLNRYVELKAEQEKSRNQIYRAYAITIISFVAGAMSFYFMLKSPSEGDIKKVMEQVLSDREATNSTTAKK